MPKQEITVTQVHDSFDGKELASDTKPINLTVGRKTWSLYLSPQNEAKFNAQIEKWTENEYPSVSGSYSPKPRVKRPPQNDPSLSAKIRTWAEEQGYEVSPRGRIANQIQDAYHAAQ